MSFLAPGPFCLSQECRLVLCTFFRIFGTNPEGMKGLSLGLKPGFSPRYRAKRRSALKGRQKEIGEATRKVMALREKGAELTVSRPFRAAAFCINNLGLKPQA